MNVNDAARNGLSTTDQHLQYMTMDNDVPDQKKTKLTEFDEPNQDSNPPRNSSNALSEEAKRKRRQKLAAWKSQMLKSSAKAATTDHKIPLLEKIEISSTDPIQVNEDQSKIDEASHNNPSCSDSNPYQDHMSVIMPCPSKDSISETTTTAVEDILTSSSNEPTVNHYRSTFDIDSTIDQSTAFDINLTQSADSLGDPLDLFMAGIDDEVDKLKQESLEKAQREIQPNTSSKRDAVNISSPNPSTNSNISYHHHSDIEDDKSFEDEFDETQDNEDIQRLTKLSNKKQLDPIDHTTIDYPPFRKIFYHEVPEIMAMTESEVQSLRESLEGIRIRGRGCPRPIRRFAQSGLPTKILDRLKRFKYELPTPIQAQSIPAIMSGRDVIGIAKTGSGKTLAFLLPMFRHILDQPNLRPGDGPIALVMAPTRELATQIHSDIREFQGATGITSCCVYGGAGIGQQIGDLKRGAHIVVCTPGRMIELLCTNKGKVTNLRRITYLVLDEADRMFDLGFEQQILRIIQNVRPNRQTVMFSATFPRQVEIAARRILISPLEITVHGRSVVSNTIEQIVELHEHSAKFRRLMELIGEWYERGSILIFADRQDTVDALFLNMMNSGYLCMSFHSGKEQMDRDEAIQSFKNGSIKIMIATSAASRGLDVANLCLVINYDAPNHLEDYVHRVGRTGRAGNQGTAVTFIDPSAEDQYAGDLVRALKDANSPVPPELDQLAKQFEEKTKKGLAQRHRSGFETGKGFVFTDEEDKLRKAARHTTQKHFAGSLVEDLLVSDNEDDEVDEDDEGGGSGLCLSQTGSTTTTTNSIQLNLGKLPGTEEESTTNSVKSILPSHLHDDMTLSQRAASAKIKQLLASKDAAVQANLNASSMSSGRSGPNDSLLSDPAKRLVKPIETHYDTEIDINDFPQNVRWKVTHKDALADIIEFTGCAITAKGVFVEPGKAPSPNERKLYLSIEGPTQDDVNNARAEIKRILEEAMSTAVMRGERPMGRYSVLEK